MALLYDCDRDRAGGPCGVAGVFDPGTSPCSGAPAQARKTASRIEGVKSERVRWELFNAARRRRFFCEKTDWLLSEELASIAEEDWSEGYST